ncbi:aminotransferase [Arthrobacter mobilis]|uniref:Aminotransferase n=1 Tax=Arthrobacter mobilis TaxID=2724944 RepID=A0A7X6HF41_9MICC|nr:aminotransferase [Arthrobacter mobilis]NKX54497.1 aminotransferase [Arthrobacter mobilis]
MKIEEFGVEQWMNRYETTCRYNLAETCVESLTVQQLLELSGRGGEVLEELMSLKLTYGPIPGSARLRGLIASLYAHQTAGNVLVTHGAIGANALVHQTLVEPGDRVLSVMPTYQQHYAIPASYGADVHILHLREENGWLPDLDELASLAAPGTKLIAINNPNNPTGALMDAAMLECIAAIADGVGAWVLCDEVYRGTDQDGGGATAAMADLYHRGISTGSMSKPFSLAGLRLGWITGPAALLEAVYIHRDYNTISVGQVDDLLACVALEAREAILARSRTITRSNLRILDEWVGSRADISYVRPASGTTALLRYAAPVPSEWLCESLLQHTGVMFTPGSAFGIEGTVRIGFADGAATLAVGLAEFSRFLDGILPALPFPASAAAARP